MAFAEVDVLQGIRVVDWTTGLAGSKGSVWLAALGAEVIHVEQPTEGDPIRKVDAIQGISTKQGDGRSIVFEVVNFNKKSVTVDLRQERGREIMYRLVEKADIFVTDQLPDTIEKLSMDYETLKGYNPQIIYCTDTLMGYQGPYRQTPEYDILGQAAAGIMATSGERGLPPLPAPWGTAEMMSAFALLCGVIAALLHRDRTGEGQRVDTSQLQALMNIPEEAILAVYSTTDDEERRTNPYAYEEQGREDQRELARNPASNFYQCRDGRWIYLAATQDKYFINIMKAIDRPDLLEDPRFDQREKRMENRRELIKIMDGVFAQRTVAEWREKFQGHDVPFYPVNSLPDLLDDPQVLANEMLWVYEHPQAGALRLPGLPFNLSESPGKITSPAPELGQHTEEVLYDLGYSEDEILRFRQGRVI